MTDHVPGDEPSADNPLGAGRPQAKDADARASRPDWNPRGPRVRRDPLGAYDELRSRCPVARGPDWASTLFSHADVTATALDHTTFSNAVSRHRQVPNGMDGSEHSEFRALVDRNFTPERVRAIEPAVRSAARELVGALGVPGRIDAVALGARFAARAQRAWLGWPADLEEELASWIDENRAATRSRDRARTAAVAQRCRAIVTSLIAARRGSGAPDDVTTGLLRDRVGGRPLAD